MLHHPNIVQVHDVGDVDGDYFIAMEYLHGEDVRHVMKEVPARGRELPLEHALAMIIGVSAGLHHAHEATRLDGSELGIIHRDVTPQNVFVTYDGGVKVVDFGIAKATNRIHSTRGGTLKGKVPYMSPEQCRSDPLDRRSDIYSVGIMLYELTTGYRLYKGNSEFEILKKIVEGTIPRPSVLIPRYPLDLEPIVMKALAKDPNDRYQTAREVQAELEAFVRENRLAVSSIALSQFMHDIFADKVAAWKKAQAEGKDLISHIVEAEDLSGSGSGESKQWVPLGDAIRKARGGGSPPRRIPIGRPGVSATGEVDGLIEDLDSGKAAPIEPGAKPVMVDPRPVGEGFDLGDSGAGLSGVLDSLDATRSEPGAGAGQGSDRSAMPVPIVLPGGAGGAAKASDVAGATRHLTPRPRPNPLDRLRDAAAFARTIESKAIDLPDEPAPPPPRATPRPTVQPIVHHVEDLSNVRISGGLGRLWLIVALLAVGGFALVLELKTDVFHPARARRRQEEAARKAEDERAAAEAKKVRTGDLVVTSEPDKAAVWLLLGRTPVDSIELSTGMDHQLRVESEGLKPFDITVTPGSWGGEGQSMRASVKAARLEVAPLGYVAPAYPPPPPVVAAPPRSGRGRIHVESDPAGANVWLLVGYTGSMRLTSQPTDREHELRVMKDGFVPAVVIVKPEQWSGKTEVAVNAKLTERPAAPSSPPRKK
jgi:hypothetical protein